MALAIGGGITIGGGISVIEEAGTPAPEGNLYTADDLSVSLSTASASPYGGAYLSYVSSNSAYPSFTGSGGDASWDFGSADWTLEFWMRWTNFVGQSFGILQVPTPAGWSISMNPATSGTIGMSFGNGQPIFGFSSFFPASNTWAHIAVTRVNTNFQVYLNGSATGSPTAGFAGAINDTSTSAMNVFNLGAGSGTSILGNVTDLRLVKGLAVYTGNFTAPTSPLALTQSANPYGGANTAAIPAGYTKVLVQP